MSYSKQTWSNGDTITADKLNHIEDGIESAMAQIEDLHDMIGEVDALIGTGVIS